MDWIHRPVRERSHLHKACRRLAFCFLLYGLWGWAAGAGAITPSTRVGIELVENTAEGPEYDRCTADGILKKGSDEYRWQVFYGEVRPAASESWEAMRSRSGCSAVTSEDSSSPRTLRGSPYLLLDVGLRPAGASGGNIRIEAMLAIHTLSGFGKDSVPAYKVRMEKRTVWLRAGGSAVIPVLTADKRESDAFGLRELLLRIRADEPSFGERADYGELEVKADVPRASILLDGGFIGRTSFEGPVVFGAVRTGRHEVIVRDPSGREAEAVARVEKGRKAVVSIALLPKPDSAGSTLLRPLGLNPQGHEEFWREKDGALVVRIPGGEFQMGSAEGEGEPAQHPRHTVRLSSFLMDKEEVTWGQYRKFAMETNRRLPKAPVWGMPEAFPVSNVTWEDARAYCEWTGGRLPTEAEWERAARNDDGRRYPWGNEWDPARCNTQEGGPHAPTAAGAYPDCVSSYGILDLAGSVSEWCQDWYDEAYYAISPVDNPTGPKTGRRRVSRGGSWVQSSWAIYSANRQGTDPLWPTPLRGFRCTQDDPGGMGK
jgi:sulfatase modifying factor 1